MVKEREFEGKDLAEALHAAAAALGIAEPDLDYKIIEQGRRGLFGVGAKSVRIMVMPPLSDTPDPMSAAGLKPPRAKRESRRGNKREGKRQDKREDRRETIKADEPRREEATGERKPRREVQEAQRELSPPSREALEVTATLQRMLELMGLELTVEATASENGVSIDLDGADRKLLTTKDGELLSALQFLLNRMARRSWPEAGRIHLACDGHRRGRDDELVELTREVAQQVRRTGRTKRLHPMNAYERRLVHLTVREFDRLGSRSEGNGHLKRVKIYKQSNSGQ